MENQSTQQRKTLWIAVAATFLVVNAAGLLVYRLTKSPPTKEVQIVAVPPQSPTGERAGALGDPARQAEREARFKALRVSGVAALGSGNYAQAIHDFTEALQAGGPSEDFGELLRIARDLEDQRKARMAKAPPAPEPAPAPAPTPTPAPAMVRDTPAAHAQRDREREREREREQERAAARQKQRPTRTARADTSREERYNPPTSPMAEPKAESASTPREVAAVVPERPLPPPPPPEPKLEEPVPTTPTTVAATTPRPETEQSLLSGGDDDNDGQLFVESPIVVGTVWINDKEYGVPPVLAKNLPVGPAKVEIRVSGVAKRSKTINVEAARRTAVRFR